MNVIVGFDHDTNNFLIWSFAKSTDIDNLPVVSGDPQIIDGGMTESVFADILNQSIQGYASRVSQPSPMIENKTEREKFYARCSVVQFSRLGHSRFGVRNLNLEDRVRQPKIGEVQFPFQETELAPILESLKVRMK